MIENIKVFKQNSIKINNIYFDPYGIDNNYNDAQYIFITHNHYDHYSKEDIDKVINDNTIFIIPDSMKKDYDYPNDVIFVQVNSNYILEDISFKTVPMYNLNKPYHKKEANWCGYLINYDGNKYYIMGDTDNLHEMKGIKCDVLFIPIGGTYTMDLDMAITCLDNIKYDIVIPVHYGSIVGDISLGNTFKDKIGDKCELRIK